MGKPRNCIMCTAAAKSAEHTFPAALGGRRTNRGIYCEHHNNGFGGLVARLENQLAMMNAALEIRPDRKDQAKPYVFVRDNTEYSLLGNKIEVHLPPPFDPSEVDANGQFQLKVPNAEVAQRWIEANTTEGLEFVIKDRGESQSHYQTEPNHIRLRMGGTDFLQSIVYLALTFFAHSFPTEARQSGIDPVKALLLEDLQDDKTRLPETLVWWDGRKTSDVVGDNPFPFGHSVLVGISEKDSHAHVYISFFSCFSFGIDLGEVQPERSFRSVRTFIDPTAQTARDSVDELKSEEFARALGERTVSLHDMIHSGSASKAIKAFTDKVSSWHADSTAKAIVEAVTQPMPAGRFERMGQLHAVVLEHRQRVFNLLKDVVEDQAEGFADEPELAHVLLQFIKADPSAPDGLAPIASMVMQTTLQVFAMKLDELKCKGQISNDEVIDLFFGATGYRLIAKEIIQPIISQGLSKS